MNIGFDAKRAFHNSTGLGNYSRTLINSLSTQFPEHDYFLFNPKISDRYKITGRNVHEILPTQNWAKAVPAVWRFYGMKQSLYENKIDLYHGLSHEIPFRIQHSNIKTVVTIHDLIFERYPEQYSKMDVFIYHQKFKYACRNAHHIIASSDQTKRDIVDLYHCDEKKITTCYQSCNPIFSQQISSEIKELVRKKYNLPQQYFLYVGSIIERKNLLSICKALKLLKGELSIPLVVIGDGKHYKKVVKEYLQANDLSKQVIFLADQKSLRNDEGYSTAKDFPAIYQSAVALIYPSLFEGFGIPILEALWSGLPVITTRNSSLPEVGGDAVVYVNWNQEEEIAQEMKRLVKDVSFANLLKEKGFLQAQKFSIPLTAESVMKVYKKLW